MPHFRLLLFRYCVVDGNFWNSVVDLLKLHSFSVNTTSECMAIMGRLST
jgi:hypothetical protein